jgi:protein-disulfide isomerase
MKELLRGRNALIAGVGLAAVLIAVGLIVASQVGSGGGSGGGSSTAALPQVAGAADTARLLHGIPQHGNVLGNPNAPVTMVEFADIQCPFCGMFAVDALPTVVREYVRPGKVKLVFDGMYFVGPDSETALRTVYAASLQGKLWNVLDLLYKNQGGENSGWVTESLLRAIGRSVVGLDVQKMLDDRNSAAVGDALARGTSEADQAHVSATPTFFAGRSGGTLQQLAITKLDGATFKAALNPLVG